MINSQYLTDSRYLDIGGIPSAFKPYGMKEIYARPFTLNELLLIHSSKSLDSLAHTYRAVSLVSSCDIAELTDGDFAYLMAWLRLYSYPKAPINATWQCKTPIYHDHYGKEYLGTVNDTEIKRRSLVTKPCDKNNVYLSHGAGQQVVMLEEDFKLPEGVDYPRAGTLLEAEDLEDDPKLSKLIPALRCVKQGKTILEKYKAVENDIALYLRAEAFSKLHTHGVREIVPIECLGCNTKHQINRPINLKAFLYGQTEESIYDMQYNLMSAFNIVPSDDMPSKRFLYHHSCFVKDMRERNERAKAAEEKRNIERNRRK